MVRVCLLPLWYCIRMLVVDELSWCRPWRLPLLSRGRICLSLGGRCRLQSRRRGLFAGYRSSLQLRRQWLRNWFFHGWSVRWGLWRILGSCGSSVGSTSRLEPFSRLFQQSRGWDVRVLILDGLYGYAGDWAGQFQGNIHARLRTHFQEPIVPARRWRPVLDAPQLFFTLRQGGIRGVLNKDARSEARNSRHPNRTLLFTLQPARVYAQPSQQ